MPHICEALDSILGTIKNKQQQQQKQTKDKVKFQAQIFVFQSLCFENCSKYLPESSRIIYN